MFADKVQMDLEVLQLAMQSSLIAYATAMNPRYDAAAHHRLIAYALEQAFAGNPEYKRLMIYAPPRHGKSELVSKLAPAWFLGKFPYKKIIAASHTATLAEDFGGEVRDLIADPLHVATFGHLSAMNPKTTARGDFKLIGGGTYFATGVGGTPIGKGADVVIIDDPIKSRIEAESPSYREKLKNWYTSAIYTRLEGDGVVILMHQRWHENDLAGYLLENHPDENWKVINLPALAEEDDDILGRVKGEALWWQRYDEKRLATIRRAVGNRDWLSMYQQRPRSLEGDEFKREYLRYYERPAFEIARSMTVYILVDAASSKKKHSDYTAMVVIGLGADGNRYLLDGVRARLSLAERASTLIELHRKWRPRFVGYEQYGQMADIEHVNSVMERDNYRFTIIPLGGRIRKEERVRRLLPDLERGDWYFPTELMVRDPQTKKLYDLMEVVIEQEMLPFPVGVNDDFIDGMSRIYDMPDIRPRVGQDKRSAISKGGPRPW